MQKDFLLPNAKRANSVTEEEEGAMKNIVIKSQTQKSDRDSMLVPPPPLSYKQSSKSEDKEMKILFIGPSGSGKSSVIQSMIENPFNPDIKSTNCYEIHLKKFQIDQNREIELKLWDCSSYHNQSYTPVKRALYKNTFVAFIVVDIQCQELENNIEEWVCECYDYEIFQVYIICNKIDTVDYRKDLKPISDMVEPKGLKIFFGSCRDQIPQHQTYKQYLQQTLKGQSFTIFFNAYISTGERFNSERLQLNQFRSNRINMDHNKKSINGELNEDEKKKSLCQLF